MKTGPNELVDESLLSEIEARDFDNKRHERLTVRVDLEKSAERRYVGLVLIAFKHAVKVRLDKNSINAEPAESSASEPKK
jgi:predicted RNA-binding protein Jag